MENIKEMIKINEMKWVMVNEAQQSHRDAEMMKKEKS